MRKITSTNFENEQQILESCAMAYTVSLIGGRWKSTILWQLMQKPKRYTELKAVIPNVSERMLTSALKALEEDGLIVKKVYPGFPRKAEYGLTPLGKSMKDMLRMMSDWGKKHQQT
jgi:DNA-binding HxlR family transcriptional regulator